ncbi:MAG: CDP-alcohol phosphatidyltransferase family protein [Thermodesulfovibrionales bacterium]|nr:CDP-alcohol phosphatidyltransferase family protein [Thermodesulfovibrionales bacterium]
MTIITIPNSLTLIRFFLIPLFIIFMFQKKYEHSLIVFSAAAFTDLLDGFVARITNQKSKLGAFLDPLADKLLLITSFILLTFNGWIPNWITLTVFMRDIIIIIGWFCLFLLIHNKNVEPSIFGKLANASQAILIGYTLVSISFSFHDQIIKTLMLILTASLTIFSGFHYIYRGLKQVYEKRTSSSY